MVGTIGKCRVLNLGLISYEQGYALQKKLYRFRREGRIDDILILLEHEPVVTIGRRGERHNILVPEEVLRAKGIKVFEIDRGGDVTLHCPGQLVGYPILDLNSQEKDVYKYLRNLEEVIIRSLKVYGIDGQRRKGYAGVWVEGRKVASIGIGIRGWITFHGFALNIDSDLSYFSLIRPCGFESGIVTSLRKVLGRPVEPEDVRADLINNFGEVFSLQMEEYVEEFPALDSEESLPCFR